MSSLQNKLDRLEAFFERENARHDEIAKERPAWWNVAKIIFGVLCVARSVSLVLNATWIGSYILAPVFLFGGAYLAYEG